ncbi:MAG: DUF1761 domain-containing protein [Flavobacteriaceae bacterium]
MKLDFLFSALAALVPLVIGFIWYSPKLFGNVWMKETGLTEEKIKSGNMPLILGLSFLFSFLIAITLHMSVIHQWGFFSMLDPGKVVAGGDEAAFFKEGMAKFGNTFRTFGHGALHGGLTALFLVLPIMATNALFERKTAKHVAINVGYWVITLALMGGIICQFADVVIA